MARLFDVALATLKRWLTLWRAGQSLAPKVGQPGPAARFDAAALEALRAQLVAAPDDRLADHCRRWQKTTDEQTSETTMWRALRALGWTRKKSIL